MRQTIKQNNFVDFVISESKPSTKKRLLKQYRICSVTRRGDQSYINLRIPAEVQQKILQAYAQGKQVRIFA